MLCWTINPPAPTQRFQMTISTTKLFSAALAAAVAATVSFAPAVSSAQGGMEMPKPGAKAPASPRDSVKTAIGQTIVSVNYGRPSKRGRDIFGGLNDMKWGMTWRMGANEATTLTTSKDIMIGNLHVPAGSYTMRVLLEETGKWQLIVNKQTGQWGTEYKPGMDLGRVPMTVTQTAAVTEQMEITITSKGKGGELSVVWDKTKATVPLMVM